MPSRAKEHFLDLEHVDVARGMKVVLHDITLRIAAGEHLAILGPNGCGKSTLIKTMTCECYPVADPGAAHPPRSLIFGRPRWDVAELRKRLGVVAGDIPSERTLHTTGRDAVLSGFFSSATLWPGMQVSTEMQQHAAAALALLEVPHLATKSVGEMSAGEMRRILIARALVHDPEMLLVDEPSNALDLAAQSELRQALRGLARKGIGLVLITHHLADIIPEIERVVMLRDGRIVADGPKQELLTETRLAELFGVPVSVAQRDGFYHVW